MGKLRILAGRERGITCRNGHRVRAHGLECVVYMGEEDIAARSSRVPHEVMGAN